MSVLPLAAVFFHLSVRRRLRSDLRISDPHHNTLLGRQGKDPYPVPRARQAMPHCVRSSTLRRENRHGWATDTFPFPQGCGVFYSFYQSVNVVVTRQLVRFPVVTSSAPVLSAKSTNISFSQQARTKSLSAARVEFIFDF